MLISACNCFVF